MEAHIGFKRVRSEPKWKIKADSINYISNLESKIKSEARRIRFHVNELKSSSTIPSQMTQSDKLFTKFADIVNFALHSIH